MLTAATLHVYILALLIAALVEINYKLLVLIVTHITLAGVILCEITSYYYSPLNMVCALRLKISKAL